MQAACPVEAARIRVAAPARAIQYAVRRRARQIDDPSRSDRARAGLMIRQSLSLRGAWHF